MGDGTCDPSNSGYACLHDGGDCLDDEHAYVAAPWLRHAKGEAGALDDWPYALASEFWVDVAKLLPSASVPECAQRRGDHATVPFKVEVGPGNKVGGYNPEEYDMFAKPATGQLRSRWLPRPNRRGALRRGPGASSSFLYKSANDEALKNELYDNATELKGTGVPYGFFYDSGCPGARDFPVVFDTNLNRTRARALRPSRGAYFNKQTLEVTVTIATVNVETGLLTYMEIVAERVKEGGIMLSDKFAIFDPRPYDGATDYFRAFLELVLVGTVLFLISMELGEMRDVYGETGALWGYLGVGNLLDLASYAVSLAMFVKWGTFWQSTTRIKPRDHYDAFADPFAVGRITEASGGRHRGHAYINAAFYWSFMVLSFFLLLNSLLAIIVEAYTTVVEEGRLEQQTDPLPFALWKARQDLKALGWRYFLPRTGPRARGGRPSSAAAGGPDDDAPAARSHKGREVGRAAPHLYARVNEVAGCPVSWRIFAWRWQKDLPDDPIVCLDHHFMRCVFHVLHKRYETRMERRARRRPNRRSAAGVGVVVERHGPLRTLSRTWTRTAP
ncbi:hypothetical protein JL720_17376 [Aureococcus anophagefferens]|nr:hypothetical protein JL720_17376 [Aureococcus anophagefferens]